MVSASFIDNLEHLDQQFTLFLNGVNSQISDQIWMFFSAKLVWIPLYLACVYFLFRRMGWKKALMCLASAGLTFALCDQVANLVKDSACRFRPCWDHTMLSNGLNILEGRGGFFGFFSAHSANAFAIAVCLTIGFRNDRKHTYNAFFIGSFLWAALVGSSRIFVGKHFFGDVVVGAIVGMSIGYFISMLARYIIQKHIDKVPATGLTFRIFRKAETTAEG